MFSFNDIKQINLDYFNLIHSSCQNIILESKNTLHQWLLQSQEYKSHRNILLYHRHHKKDAFHIQKFSHPRNILQAQKIIQIHDQYHIEKLCKTEPGSVFESTQQ